MEFDTLTSATYVARNLKNLLHRASRDTAEVIMTGDIATVATHFSEIRDTYKMCSKRSSQPSSGTSKASAGSCCRRCSATRA